MIETRHPQQVAADAVVSGVGEWNYDLASKLYSGSSECCRIRCLQRAADERTFTSDAWWHGIHHDDLHRVEQALERLHCASSKNMCVRYRFRNAEAGWQWVVSRASVVRHDVDGKPLKIKGVDVHVNDFHEERANNDMPSEDVLRPEVALASADQGLWQIDFRLGIRTENDTWRTIRGYPANSSYSSNHNWQRDIHPDDLSLVMNHNNCRIDRDNDDIDFTYRQRHADGSWQWIWSRGKVLERDNQKRPLVLAGTDIDITDIKEAEIRNEHLSNTLEIAMQAAGMGVWEWTLDAEKNVWNRRTRECIGIDSESEHVSHAQFMALVHPADRDELETALQSAVLERRDIDVEYRIRHPRKGLRYIVSKAKRHATRGQSPRYIGIVWDVTDMVFAEQKRVNMAKNLSHTRRLKSIGELAGGVAHDFNNLLAIISGNAQLLSTTLRDENRFLDAIAAAAERGAALTQRLLAHSRRQALQPVSVDMGELVNNLCMLLKTTLGSTITIRSKKTDTLWRCVADPVELENALINLIVNARDAMPKGGSITITIENKNLDDAFARLVKDVTPGDYVKVSVSDSGKGMSTSILDKSMDPFFTTKASGEGHGLGLSIIFGFIKQSSGHITINSEENVGTDVSLYLPRDTGKVQLHTSTQKNMEHLPVGHGESILLVEDDLLVQEMISKSLGFLGYKTVCVSSATAAINEFNKPSARVDLVITDIILSEEMNGFELGSKLRSKHPETRILYISGLAQDSLNRQDAKNNDVAILHKPFSVENLALNIAQQLQS